MPQENILETIQSSFRQGQHRFTVHALLEATAAGMTTSDMLSSLVTSKLLRIILMTREDQVV